MLYAIVAVLALILDQAVKYWTTVNIVVDTGEAKLIPGFIHFANVHNTGAAFSFLEGARWFFVILCILFCLLVVYVLVKNIITHRLARWMAVLVMAGAIGNCIDRIVCGYVVDMLEFDFMILGRRFPVFNIADIYITLGAIIFCICILQEKPRTARKNIPLSEGRGSRPAAEPQTAAEPTQAAPTKQAAPAKHSFARRQRTPIPDFPKREHVNAETQTAVNHDDPFAEWEKPAAPAPAPAAPAGTTTVYTQPAAAQKNYSPDAVDFVNLLSEQPAKPAAPAAAPVQPTPAAPAAPQPAPAPAPKAPAAPAAKPAPKADSESFNLDDILAEFRDL